ncbi:hypothetical protein [Ralstonia solanacearum]|uniref:hypothetical protein n=1 Tax=Ralstonia solanacearum TaxID=305 RepID=UPI00202AB942|nr:hypothetical protein [Ralstonia solanacearum]MCL9845485.1 hypothetical protein [Ralstonia solanacearum]MDC6259573.1 hypothetical protein [Ralstonia solanacearum]MDC6303738.1 hypothetical protein [Ralstonia solanacearum]
MRRTLPRLHEQPARHPRGNLFDPATGEEVNIKVDFSIPDEELEEILYGQEFAQSAAVRAADYAIPIALKVSQERTTAMVSEQAVISAFKKLGLENADAVPEDRMQEFMRYVAEGITPYVLHLKNIPPGATD